MLIKICIKDDKPDDNIKFACQSNDVEIYPLMNNHFIMLLDHEILTIENQKINNRLKNIYYESTNYTKTRYYFFKKKFAKYNGILFDNYFYIKLYEYIKTKKLKLIYIKYDVYNNSSYDSVIFNGNNIIKVNPSTEKYLEKESFESIIEKVKNNDNLIITELSFILNNRPIIFLKNGYLMNTSYYTYFEDNKNEIINILNNGIYESFK